EPGHALICVEAPGCPRGLHPLTSRTESAPACLLLCSWRPGLAVDALDVGDGQPYTSHDAARVVDGDEHHRHLAPDAPPPGHVGLDDLDAGPLPHEPGAHRYRAGA